MNPTWVLVTGNDHKWHEAQRILGVPLERVRLDLPELQEESIAAVAREKAFAAFERLQRPCIVEDAGIELAALGGFPGPFIKYWERQGGHASICRALDTQSSRKAVAVCALGIASAQGVHLVEGRVSGTIAKEPVGDNGFGWDSIFVPDGEQRTFAQMTAEEKDAQSHRRRAWEAAKQMLMTGLGPATSPEGMK
jgi:non-canonical purine NTP pyrophosphatase (RdgB/HAM1 family)